MDTRSFENSFPETTEEKILNDDGLVRNDLEKKLDHKIEIFLKQLEKGFEKDADWTDLSVYTGTTGIALMYYHLYNTMGGGLDEDSEEDEPISPIDDPYFEKSMKMVERQIKDMKRKRVTFLCGDPGPLALGAVLYHKLKKKDDAQMCIRRLISRCEDVLGDDSLPDEMLFGRAGFLWSLIFVRKQMGPTFIDGSTLVKLFKSIIKSGETMAEKNKSKWPLMFQWHEKNYLGAAHGYVGILCTLMQVEEADVKSLIQEKVKPMIDILMSHKMESGNYPSSLESKNGDKLVHWCHGAPGWVYMFLLAHKRFGEDKYLTAAKNCCDVIWSRGLLRKGYGLCHGVAGNAYAFLALFKATKDQNYLHKAVKFGEWCMEHGSHGCRDPDRPWSLFEGLAGVIYFLADLVDPLSAKFPGFEL